MRKIMNIVNHFVMGIFYDKHVEIKINLKFGSLSIYSDYSLILFPHSGKQKCG